MSAAAPVYAAGVVTVGFGVTYPPVAPTDPLRLITGTTPVGSPVAAIPVGTYPDGNVVGVTVAVGETLP